jgi:TM2 domain-containing membrane protein YozV
MTDPSQFGNGGQPYPPPSTAYPDPTAPFGRHPITGEPYSDKQKLVAGLLQLLGIFGIVGIGRMYLGQVALGVLQLVVGLVTCAVGALIWGVIDAILILTDKVRDSNGRPLRD